MSKRNFYRLTDLMIELGGANAVRQKLIKYGFGSLPFDTVYGWQRRDSAPGHFMLAMVEIAMREGIVSKIEKLRK